MDHKLAESLQYADKYSLNEMSESERTQFEEHMFDCPICSEQVRETFTVVENLKEVLREEATASEPERTPRAGFWVGLGDWLRLPSLVPTFAALALAGVLVYQNSNTAAVGDRAQILIPGSVVAPVSRGAKPMIPVNPKAGFFLMSFSVDSAKSDSFVCDFRDNAGKQIISLKSAPQATASFNLPILLPVKSFPAGEYQMMLHAVSEPGSITTYPFVVTAAEDTK